MTRTSRSRAAFTLIELLVVMAIIGVLIALLLPAVQSARGAARRVECANNMMQMSLALQNYESSHEVLPPGVVDSAMPIANKAERYHMSWIAQLLPYIEQRNVFNNINFTNSAYAVENSTARSTVSRVFLCSMEMAPEIVTGAGQTNYAGVHHHVEAPIADNNTGTFFLNSRLRTEDIEDGSSQTLFIGEKLRQTGDLGWLSGTRATLRNMGTPLNKPVAATTPNPVGGFSSLHPGGANFAFGDGSVRFVRDSIAADVYQRMANRKDGEILSSTAY